MKEVGSFEAKTHLSELLTFVARGEKITITRHGQKIALLVPYVNLERESSVKGAIRAIKRLRSKTTLGKELSIKEMKAEGRK
jgi:prevent-host-death family protein